MASTPAPSYLSRSNSAIRAASSTPQPNGVPPTPAAEPPAAPTIVRPWKIPQSFTTNYSIRVKNYQTSLVVPAIQASTSTLPPRSARRGQTAINYAEDDDDEYEGRESRTRSGQTAAPIVPEEISAPVNVPGRFPHKSMPVRGPDLEREGAAQLPTVLIPVTYERDIDATKKIRERFTWNLYESDVTFERFARQFCSDLDLDPTQYVDDIATTVRTACLEWGHIATTKLADNLVDPISGVEGSYLVNCKINVQCGVDTLTDQFMFDLFETSITPEEFAKALCEDVGYHGEYVGAIANAVREELLKHKKELLFPSGQGPPPYNWMNDAHPNHPGLRYDPENLGRDWCPNIERLTREEVERKEIDREREARRLRRETAKVNPVSTVNAYLYGTGIDSSAPQTPAADSLSRRKRQPMLRDDSPMRRGSSSGAGGMTSLASAPVPLPDSMMGSWRCSHCLITATNTWGARDGPDGRYTLCAICGHLYYEDRKLPLWRKDKYERKEEAEAVHNE
ncbi:hypothetical protein ABW21_db0200937 [Orbilia brochopaga]|nr:hypothetical protein ABW21_db0200937 [Drechslerella brochopaga]